MVILEEETYKKFGYYARDLKQHSSKKIVCECAECGKRRETNKRDYGILCRSCSSRRSGKANKGRIKTKEEKLKISEARKGLCCGIKNHMYGKHHSEDTKRKISNNRVYPRKEAHPSWKGGLIQRVCLECGKTFEVAPSVITAGNGKFCSKSCGAKASRRCHVFPTKFTKPERIFEEICKRNNLPFYYVGNDKVSIGEKGDHRLHPDFIERSGKKRIIEIMGQYWHSPLVNSNIPETGRQIFRKKHFKKYGWKSVFIWDTDLLREDAEAFVLYTLKKYKFIYA